MKKWWQLCTLLLLIPAGVRAEFSSAALQLHPAFPGTGPFIIDINDTWPNDCHPGEQKPVVESFDGNLVEIGFETIVVHVTCNPVDTPYRLLIDMSAAVAETPPAGDNLDILLHYGEATLERTVPLICPASEECAAAAVDYRQVRPGVYVAPQLNNQGLLLVRQNTGMAVYPLVYDPAGRAEWLFTGAHLRDDAFFTEILRLTGGDCLGCEPTGARPHMETIGFISLLADQPGVLQVKIDDGLFTRYQSLVFGYQTYRVGPDNQQTLIDLAGRWGLSENRGTDPPLGDLTQFIPGAFDITLDYIGTQESGENEGLPPATQLVYLVSTPAGDTLGQLVCNGDTAADGVTARCDFIDPTDAAEPLLRFYQEGPASLRIAYGRAVVAVGVPPGGRAVRLD